MRQVALFARSIASDLSLAAGMGTGGLNSATMIVVNTVTLGMRNDFETTCEHGNVLEQCPHAACNEIRAILQMDPDKEGRDTRWRNANDPELRGVITHQKAFSHWRAVDLSPIGGPTKPGRSLPDVFRRGG